MSSPEDKQKRLRRRSALAKELEEKKYRQRKVKDKKRVIDIKNLTHRELVELIQEHDLTKDE
jgi:7,8-dihydro-6-hydroxymethylpterin-pyrophosphokinase